MGNFQGKSQGGEAFPALGKELSAEVKWSVYVETGIMKEKEEYNYVEVVFLCANGYSWSHVY